MKKYLIILIVLITILCLLVLLKNNKQKLNKIPDNNGSEFSFYDCYKKENLNKYKEYKIKNPDLKNKDIILRVNIGLDHGFYTETHEVKEFDILMLVNKYNYVTKDFIPNDLVLLDSYSKKNMYLNKEAANAFIEMAKQAEAEGYHIRAVSTYRTLEYQENLYNNYVKKDGISKADTYSARPGYSEHHTGLAVDIDNKELSYTNFINTKEFNWMLENSYKYGYILRYPSDSTITGYIYEPWHYRYVGSKIAETIHNKNITFEEYYYEYLNK